MEFIRFYWRKQKCFLCQHRMDKFVERRHRADARLLESPSDGTFADHQMDTKSIDEWLLWKQREHNRQELILGIFVEHKCRRHRLRALPSIEWPGYGRHHHSGRPGWRSAATHSFPRRRSHGIISQLLGDGPAAARTIGSAAVDAQRYRQNISVGTKKSPSSTAIGDGIGRRCSNRLCISSR